MTTPTFETITYSTTPIGPLELDLFTPTGFAGRRPGVVCVHGGGWNAGSRHQFRWHAGELARLGYVAISISYRLMPAAIHPAQLDDCQRAVRWFRRNADKLALDPARIGALGSSAGGHLVACLGTRDTRLAPADDDAELRGLSSRVPCVVDVHGVHDFLSMEGHPELDTTCRQFAGGKLSERRSAWEDASPLWFVDGSSAATLLFHDPTDTCVPFDQSVRLEQALRAAGRPTQLVQTPGAGHGFVYGPDNPWTRKIWPTIVEWLGQHLRLAATQSPS